MIISDILSRSFRDIGNITGDVRGTHKILLIGKNTTETWITIFKLNAKQWWQEARAEPQES